MISPRIAVTLCACMLVSGPLACHADLALDVMPYQPSAAPRNIFGTDDRVPVTSHRYPWSVIGTFQGIGCTGTLVGPRWVLTAAHCVVDGDTGVMNPNLSYFLVNQVAGQAQASVRIERVWWGTDHPNQFRDKDWALLELSEDAGNRFGWLGIRNVDLRYFDHYAVYLAGYSGDYDRGNTATADLSCSIRNARTFQGVYLHDCENTRGASGAAVFEVTPNGEHYIVALNVAEYRHDAEASLTVPTYSEDYANIAISIAEPLSLLMQRWSASVTQRSPTFQSGGFPVEH